ncbi:PREDICTED: putative uncharacterized protein encoded by LINC00482 [Dipodomys ordii]|uniref:Uncharacterized protein n=1 Tax=Dipodomys ordii TaxID=10020 RepID=A0A1S3EUW8_DIPOR|nr:PREDICTED: putative uncharacterized protein encoded by LINC00482 [Dipodomys ordii]
MGRVPTRSRKAQQRPRPGVQPQHRGGDQRVQRLKEEAPEPTGWWIPTGPGETPTREERSGANASPGEAHLPWPGGPGRALRAVAWRGPWSGSRENVCRGLARLHPWKQGYTGLCARLSDGRVCAAPKTKRESRLGPKGNPLPARPRQTQPEADGHLFMDRGRTTGDRAGHPSRLGPGPLSTGDFREIGL